MLTQLFQWLENGSVAASIRQSTWMYPALEIVHIIGIVLLVGPAFMFDLRLLGVGKQLSIPSLADFLLPWSRRALFLIIPSGVFLFVTNAIALSNDPVFWTKMFLIVVAGSNAIYFHRFILRSISQEKNFTVAQGKARMAAVISIVAWISVISCGRLLAY